MTMVVLKVEATRPREACRERRHRARRRPSRSSAPHSSIEAEVVRGLLDAHGIEATVASALVAVGVSRCGSARRSSASACRRRRPRHGARSHRQPSRRGRGRRSAAAQRHARAARGAHRLPVPRPRPARARADAPIARARGRLGRRHRQRVARVPRRRRARLRHRRHAVPSRFRRTAKATSRR